MYLASPLTVAASAVAGYIVEYEPAGQREPAGRDERSSIAAFTETRVHVAMRCNGGAWRLCPSLPQQSPCFWYYQGTPT